MRILEFGSGEGDLLKSLNPSFGIGLDFSIAHIKKAQKKHSDLIFILADAHFPPINSKVDYVIISDLVNDLWDVQLFLSNFSHLLHERTRIIINSFSNVWQLPLKLASGIGLKQANLEQNWFTVQDLRNLLELSDNESIKVEPAILLPVQLSLLSTLANRFLSKIWPFSLLAITNIIVARKSSNSLQEKAAPSASVIIPARNEQGNIRALFERTPHMGAHTELIFVEGHSKDDTYETIKSEMKNFPKVASKLFRQKGIGKADAVRMGFSEAKGDILMILDADISVSPEDLPRFFNAIAENKAEFVNGVRLVYPMEEYAMRTLNLIGNKTFGIAFSWLIGQNVKDTLCGTKVLRKKDYEIIVDQWPELGEKDPFGDFELLLGASKLGLKILDLPVRYKQRTYGTTNINRWRHGAILVRMVIEAATFVKFA